MHWYSSDILERPGEPEFQNWPAWKQRKRPLPHLVSHLEEILGAHGPRGIEEICPRNREPPN